MYFVDISKPFALMLGLLVPSMSCAHFMSLLPSTDMVDSKSETRLDLAVSFMHPFEGGRMDMAAPIKMGVHAAGKYTDLSSDLKAQGEPDARHYRLQYRVDRPGDYIFYVDPAPYWEPAEERFIVHQTKVVVNALGLEQGWDDLVGLKAEIEPLTRPYGLWAGNLFTARVIYQGQAVPFAEVEVTLQDGAKRLGEVPEPQRIQVIKADQNGVFSYAMPTAGWWGFAALLEDDQTSPGPDGKSYPIELGAVIWVKAHALPR